MSASLAYQTESVCAFNQQKINTSPQPTTHCCITIQTVVLAVSCGGKIISRSSTIMGHESFSPLSVFHPLAQ